MLGKRIFLKPLPKGQKYKLRHRCNIWVEDKAITKKAIDRWYAEATGNMEAVMPECDAESNENIWYIRVSLAKSLGEKDEIHKFWKLFLQIVESIKKCAELSGITLSNTVLESLKEEVLFTWGTTELAGEKVTGYIHHNEGKSSFEDLVLSLAEDEIQLVIVVEDFEEYETLYKETGDGGLALFLFHLSAKSCPWLPMTLLLISSKQLDAEIQSNMGDGSDFFAAYEKAE